jgi:hypothetical protein
MLDRTLLLTVTAVLLLTFYDLNRSYLNKTNLSSSSNHDASENQQEDISFIPTPKMKMQTVPIIKFRYCQSSGYVFKRLVSRVYIFHLKVSKSIQAIF